MAASGASRSNAASSSSAIGRALANSAASSSFASGVTLDLHVCEWLRLMHAQFAHLGQFEQAEEGRQHERRLGVPSSRSPSTECAPANRAAPGSRQRRPARRAGARRRRGCAGRRAARSTRSTAASSSLSDRASGAGGGRRVRRRERTSELIAALLTAALEQVDHFAHLLVFEQAAHQLGARVLPGFGVAPRGRSIWALMRSSRAAISR